MIIILMSSFLAIPSGKVKSDPPVTAEWRLGDNSPAKRSTVLAGASNVHKLEFLLYWLSNDKASTGSKRLSYRPLQNV
jgi:hypothetical protein